jgi:hypothetical protein
MRAHKYPLRRSVEEVILSTRPVLYIPMQDNIRPVGGHLIELVRGANAQPSGNAFTGRNGPFRGAKSVLTTTSTAQVQVATHASYHPGDTFSIGGWFNRTEAGDTVNGPCLYHTNGDLVIWFPPTTNAGRLVMRKSGGGDVFASAATDWGTPYTKGWHRCLFWKNAGSSAGLYM